jgi:hypothetical protein
VPHPATIFLHPATLLTNLVSPIVLCLNKAVTANPSLSHHHQLSSKMPKTIIPSLFFLPLGSVKLGRFVTSIDQPHESYHEPPTTEVPKPLVAEFLFTSENQNSTNASFGSTLTSLISAGFSKRAKSKIHIAPAHGTTYSLDNSEAWFDEAVGLSDTRRWIEKAALRGDNIYMIVGITTLTDARLVLKSVGERQVGGQINVPVGLSLAAAGVIVPLAGLIDPTVHGKYQNIDDVQSQYIAPGEQVCALQYRKICHKWLSGRLIERSRLSKTRQWSCMEGERRDAYEDEEDEEDDDEDMMEVGFEDMDKLDGEWEIEEISSGEIVCIRL